MQRRPYKQIFAEGERFLQERDLCYISTSLDQAISLRTTRTLHYHLYASTGTFKQCKVAVGRYAEYQTIDKRTHTSVHVTKLGCVHGKLSTTDTYDRVPSNNFIYNIGEKSVH